MLRSHVRANHRCTEVFKCGSEGCAFLTTSRSGLRDHHRTHHGGTTDAPLKCPLCPFTTPSQEALAQVLAGYYFFGSPVFLFVYYSRDHNGIRLTAVLPRVSLSRSIFRRLCIIADPTCLSPIRIFPSRIPDSGFRVKKIPNPDPHKNFCVPSYFS